MLARILRWMLGQLDQAVAPELPVAQVKYYVAYGRWGVRRDGFWWLVCNVESDVVVDEFATASWALREARRRHDRDVAEGKDTQ